MTAHGLALLALFWAMPLAAQYMPELPEDQALPPAV